MEGKKGVAMWGTELGANGLLFPELEMEVFCKIESLPFQTRIYYYILF